MRQWLLLAFGAISLAGCNSAAVTPPATLTLNSLSGNNQIASSGAAAAAPLTVQVVTATGGVAGVTVNASSDTRFCTVSPASLSTDASGNAAFTVTALGVTGVNCGTSFAVVGQAAARGSVNFNTAIRAAQRPLIAPTAVSLPTATVGVTDAGAAAGSINVSAASNLPVPDASHVYGVYLAKQDANGNVSAVTLLGKTSSFPLVAPLVAPANLAAGGYNVVALVLQSVGTGKVENLNNATLVSIFTPVAAGTANVTLSLSSDGLRIPAAYALPLGAAGQVSLTNPNLTAGFAGDGISVAWNALPVNPSGWTYVVYATDDASNTGRLGNFNSNGRTGNFNYGSPTPANGALPTAITDLKAKFSRVFITLEPVSSGDGGPANATAGASVVLDNASSAWVFGAGLPKTQ